MSHPILLLASTTSSGTNSNSSMDSDQIAPGLARSVTYRLFVFLVWKQRAHNPSIRRTGYVPVGAVVGSAKPDHPDAAARTSGTAPEMARSDAQAPLTVLPKEITLFPAAGLARQDQAARRRIFGR
jgi:hypothetical protein